MNNKYLFDHIHKTGGTTMHGVFSSILGNENVSPLINFKRLSHVLTEYKRFQLIQGHFNFMPGDSLPVERLVATVLRDPVDRCLSSYFYYRHDTFDKIGIEFIQTR